MEAVLSQLKAALRKSSKGAAVLLLTACSRLQDAAMATLGM